MRDGFAGLRRDPRRIRSSTVNTNDSLRADVPTILRGIYAYHTQSQGWSDVGYNFLVDRFGRSGKRWRWHPPGCHRSSHLGHNENAFAMSAIGNFEVVAPSQRCCSPTRCSCWGGS
jgi:hypothetical protein